MRRKIKELLSTFFIPLTAELLFIAYFDGNNAQPLWQRYSLVGLTPVSAVLFYYVTANWLVRLPLLRRLIVGKICKYEGYWAERLFHHPNYTYSLAKISYDADSDEFVYSGVPFEKDTPVVEGGRWRTNTLDFNEKNRIFVFSSSGKINRDGKEVILSVKSFGALSVEDGHFMSGDAMDIGDANFSQAFRIEAYRVKKKHVRETIKKPLEEATAAEKVQLIKHILKVE